MTGTGSPAAPFPWRAFREYVLGNGLALLMGLAVTVIAVRLNAPGTLDPRTTDFLPYYSAARLVVTGHASDIYNLAALQRTEAPIAYPLAIPNHVMPYLYAPFSAILLAPLGALPYTLAYTIWFAFLALAFVVGLYFLESHSGLQGKRAFLFRFGMLCSLPAIQLFVQAQMSSVLLALFAVVFFLLVRRTRPAAGVALAAASVKPHYVVPLLVVLLVRREWGAISSFALTLVALLTIPLLLAPSVLRQYVQLVGEVSGWRSSLSGFAPRDSESLFGFWHTLLHDPSATASLPTALTLATSALVLLVLVAFTLRARRIDVPIGLAILTGLLVAPHVLLYDLVLLAIPLALLLRSVDSVRALYPVIVAGYLAADLAFLALLFAPVQVFTVVMVTMLAGLVWLGLMGPAGALHARPLPRGSRPEAERTEVPASVEGGHRVFE